ncbi:MAG TPA: FHA domain-containing protein, partial [Candidatus Acidoferrum sp.]|nr:FHA domain-containing protein [Candidatus Acidoferrum sp.]
MAKLVLSMDGLVLKEIALGKERVTIGRKPHNDVQIDNLAVSGEHAVVVTILSDSFLEDLGSTNGTLVNGLPIKKHFLQNNDVVELGKYRLKYVSDGADAPGEQQEFEKTMVIRPQTKHEAAVPVGVATFSSGQTPPSGLVDTAQGPATVAMTSSMGAGGDTPITVPLPQ